jgi:hypothetical protein
MENAPEDMSSWSSAAALLAESVCVDMSNLIRRRRYQTYPKCHGFCRGMVLEKLKIYKVLLLRKCDLQLHVEVLQLRHRSRVLNVSNGERQAS